METSCFSCIPSDHASRMPHPHAPLTQGLLLLWTLLTCAREWALLQTHSLNSIAEQRPCPRRRSSCPNSAYKRANPSTTTQTHRAGHTDTHTHWKKQHGQHGQRRTIMARRTYKEGKTGHHHHHHSSSPSSLPPNPPQPRPKPQHGQQPGVVGPSPPPGNTSPTPSMQERMESYLYVLSVTQREGGNAK